VTGGAIHGMDDRPGGPPTLVGGIVAHNEERNLASAVRSLVDQELPGGIGWHRLWIVASGCTDGTVSVAERLAREDPRVRVVVEPHRLGKAHALRQVFEQARGTALVLLNADARAEPGSVAALLRAGLVHPPPFAVMARPVVPGGGGGRWSEELRLMWSLHHEFHVELQELGGGAHLSDELLLVSLPGFPPLPEGTINDGSYFGVWLSQHGGHRLYAPDARVAIEVPWSFRDHLQQRRRILFGNGQVAATLGAAPSTLVQYALRSPRRALELLQRSDFSGKNRWARLAWLAAAESAAMALATWDRLPPRKDHVRWRRIRPTGTTPAASPSRGGNPASTGGARPTVPLEHRVSTVVRIASEFGTGLRLPELLRLLPNDAPATVPEVRDWLETRPHVARVDGEVAFAPEAAHRAEGERLDRGRQYLGAAHALFAGPLRRALPWTQCISVTGSAAYGEPHHGDDLDLFVVTRTGCTWWFLAYAYLCVRLARWRRADPREPTPCFNFVLEEGEAVDEFTRSRGFLFAREALSARPVHGEAFYRALLSHAPWMVEEIPRLYAERAPAPAAPHPPPARSPALARLLGLAVFPWLATYLQLVGLRRDAGFRRASAEDQRFRTETRWRRLMFTSKKFERLREGYGGLSASGATDRSEVGRSAPRETRRRRGYPRQTPAPPGDG
jgi:hypothetical protein